MAPQAYWHIGVYFYNDRIRHLADRGHVGSADPKVKIPMPVHGGGLEHSHIHMPYVFPVIPEHLRIPQGLVKAHPLINQLPLNAAAMPGIPGDPFLGIGDFGDFWLPQGNPAPKIHVPQGRVLLHTPGQLPVQHAGMDHTKPIIHPGPRLYRLHCLLGGNPFFPIFLLIIHICYLLLNCLSAGDFMGQPASL